MEKIVEIKKIKDLAQESWKCENCKFLFLEDNDGELIGHCELGISDGSDSTNYQIADDDVVDWHEFGCIKFEDK